MLSRLTIEIIWPVGLHYPDWGEIFSTKHPAMVNSVFKELIYRMIEKIKNEPYFKWSNRMGGDPIKRNQNLYCQYHQDRGHTTKDCRTLQIFLDQLVRAGKLKQFLHQFAVQREQPIVGSQRNSVPRSSLGTINVIFAALRKGSSSVNRVMTISPQSIGDGEGGSSKKFRM